MSYSNGVVDEATANIVTLEAEFKTQPAPPTKAPRPAKGVSPAEHAHYEPIPTGDVLADMLARVRVDGFRKVEAPPAVITYNGAALCTANSMSVVSGKAKSKKSLFVALLAGMVINPHSTNIGNAPLKPAKSGDVLLFDTEQSEYYATNLAKNIRWVADREHLPSGDDGLYMYRLQELNPYERMDVVRGAIEHHAKTCRLVIIDGIRDLVMSINDETEATMMNTWLLNTACRYNVHIVVVLHENKSTDTLRGHIGTELQNKAENVFTVTSGRGDDKEYSAIDATMYRGAGMDRIGIKGKSVVTFDGSRIWAPEFTEDSRIHSIGNGLSSSQATAKVTVTSLTTEQHNEIAAAIWQHNPNEGIRPSELKEMIATLVSESLGLSMTQRVAGQYVTHWRYTLGLINDNGVATKGKEFKPSDKLAEQIRTASRREVV